MILKVMAPIHTVLIITHQSIEDTAHSLSTLANTGNCGQRKGESNIEHTQ